MQNQFKTVLLLASLSGILLFMGWVFGGRDGLTTALIISFAMNFISYFFSESIVLRMYRAKKLDANQYSWIYDSVRKLSQKMNIPMPKLWIIDSNIANAFATGRNPSHASVVITSGILSLLNQEELQGVLAHELSHIKNRDILVNTIAATLAASISYLAQMMQSMAFWQSRSDQSGQRTKTGPISMLFIAVLTPISATLIQLAISRSREYLADEKGAEYSHTPLALASALQKINDNVKIAHLTNTPNHASTASLFIINPLWGRGWISLFATHPPVQERIERLRRMNAQSF